MKLKIESKAVFSGVFRGLNPHPPQNIFPTRKCNKNNSKTFLTCFSKVFCCCKKQKNPSNLLPPEQKN